MRIPSLTREAHPAYEKRKYLPVMMLPASKQIVIVKKKNHKLGRWKGHVTFDKGICYNNHFQVKKN